MKEWLRRGELAKVLGIPVPTVKYYTALGLFLVRKKTDHGQYLYHRDETRQRYLRVRELKDKRLTIREIKDRLQIEVLIRD